MSLKILNKNKVLTSGPRAYYKLIELARKNKEIGKLWVVDLEFRKEGDGND